MPWLDFCSRTPSEESLTFQDILFSLITAANFSASCCSCLSFFRDSWNFSWKKHIKSSRVKCQTVSGPRHGKNGGETMLTSGDASPRMKNWGQNYLLQTRDGNQWEQAHSLFCGGTTWTWIALSSLLSLPIYPLHSTCLAPSWSSAAVSTHAGPIVVSKTETVSALGQKGFF